MLFCRIQFKSNFTCAIYNCKKYTWSFFIGLILGRTEFFKNPAISLYKLRLVTIRGFLGFWKRQVLSICCCGSFLFISKLFSRWNFENARARAKSTCKNSLVFSPRGKFAFSPRGKESPSWCTCWGKNRFWCEFCGLCGKTCLLHWIPSCRL